MSWWQAKLILLPQAGPPLEPDMVEITTGLPFGFLEPIMAGPASASPVRMALRPVADEQVQIRYLYRSCHRQQGTACKSGRSMELRCG